MNNKSNGNFKKIQSNSEVDYYLKLHALLNPNNMKLILKEKSQKLREIITIKELYSNVYSSTYSNDFKDDIRTKMRSKINLQEAKHLCEFINAIGIIESGKDPSKKVYFDSDLGSGKKHYEDNDKIFKKSKIFKNNSTTFKGQNIVTKNKTLKYNESIPKKDLVYTTDNLNNFVKRNTKNEKSTINLEEKPNFIQQIDSIKEKKISINTFPFNEKDEIKILNENSEGEVVVNLVQANDKSNISAELPKDKDPNESSKSKILAEREIFDFTGKVIQKQTIYTYPEKIIGKDKKNNKSDINENKIDNEIKNSSEDK